ncbi:hypothetical protein EBZ80_04180 [bacterium]|nr:hypothetical protein [bacterium]
MAAGLAVLAMIWPACLFAEANSTAARVVPAKKDSFQKIWKIQELLPPPAVQSVKSETIGDWSARQGTNVVTRVTKAQSGPNVALREFHDRQGIISNDDQNLRIAALQDVKRAEFQETRELSKYLMNELGKAIGAHAQENSEFLRKLGQGLSFNLGGRNASPAQSAANNSSVRYGLVLRDVKPTGKGVHVAALTMDDSYLDRALASRKKAQVDWTIGPISETNNNVFPDLGNDTAALEPVKAQGIFGMRPDLSLTGKVIPNFSPDNGGKPSLRLRLEQPQGLYRMETLAGGFPGKNTVHEIRLPVYRKLTLTRQFDSRMEATKSSVLNVFGFSEVLGQQPLNLHYAHADASLKAETGFDVRKGRVGVEANFANVGGAQHPRPGSCAVNYGRSF